MFDDAEAPAEEKPASDKPFDDTPFDAGVEASEEEDPVKFIQQLSGKLGTSLRKYSDDLGKPDFDLEKYAINSVISATHTAEMPEDDQKDIIDKIKDAGKGDVADEAQPEEAPAEEAPSEETPAEEVPSEELDEASPYIGNDPHFEKDSNFATAEGKGMWEDDSHFEMNELLAEDEEGNSSRYMFFSNLEQVKREAELLLDLDPNQIEEILQNGHDWAQDHIATAKESIDQVFDFLMNKINGKDNSQNEYEVWSKSMDLKKKVVTSDDLKYHLDNQIALGETIFRYGSQKYIDLLSEVKKLYDNDLISLNENDEHIINEFNNNTIKVGGVRYMLDFIMESDEIENINEAEYKGKEVNLNKPKRGGSKKFYVYTKNPKTGKVIKVSFGAKAGGGNLAVKLRDPEARKAFAARHNCEQKNDKTKPGYWACRLPRYAKLLGLSGGGKWW